MSLATATFISYDVEPFLPTLLSHGPEGSSAYPPVRNAGLLPLNIFYGWGLKASDKVMQDAARQSAARVIRRLLRLFITTPACLNIDRSPGACRWNGCGLDRR